MSLVNINIEGANSFYSQNEYKTSLECAYSAFETLINREGRGSDYLGWLDLPVAISAKEIGEINSIAKEWQNSAEVVVVIGIGGSYLGARAALEALQHPFAADLNIERGPKMVFAGHHLSQDYMTELLELLTNREYAIVVISKSGTTTEPAVAFRLLKNHLELKYGKEEAAKRVVAITDKSVGALKRVAESEGYRTFVIPDDVGGRYSVLTPVGLLPIAVAGFNIEAMIEGASKMRQELLQKSENNSAIQYAALRNLLYTKGKLIEILVNYNPKLQYFAEWWKQLFGESEGKEGKGIFPASVNFTSDLHSMGQYIQEGERTLFETVISVKESSSSLLINSDPADADGLNYIAGMEIESVNKKALLGTLLAHVDGGVPTLLLEIESLNERNLGALFYFFEFACGVSAYMLGINPFDQPGVEAYKKNMFALLGKPGYEELAAKLKERTNSSL